MNISKQPDPISLTGNPVPLHVTGSNMVASPGIKAYALLSFVTGQSISPGSSLSLNWGINIFNISFVANPIPQSWQFRSGVIDSQWISDFTELLRQHYELELNYLIQPGAQVYAKLTGSAWNISVITNIPSSALNVYTRAGADAVFRTNYQILCQVRTWPGNANIGEDVITPGADQKAEFDLSGYLDTHLTLSRRGLTNFTWPPQTQRIRPHTAHTMQFYLRYAERWDNQVQRMHSTGVSSALLGGISKQKLHEFAATNTTFYSHLTQNSPFLTWQPVVKPTGQRTPERLYFYNSGSRTIVLKVRKWYVNGTDTTVTLYSKAVNTGVVELDCSYNNFSQGEVTIEKYDIWLESAGVKISEVRSYLPDHRYYRNEEYFVFRNSLGGYDTLRCTGRRTLMPEFDRETFEDDNKLMHALENQQTINYEINTGSLDPLSAAWLDDLFLSLEVYWIKGARMIPILITGKKKNKITDDQLRLSFDIEFSLASTERFFSMPETVNSSSTIAIS